MIVDATATKTKVRLANQQLLPIGKIVRCASSVRIVDKEELAIKDLRKEFVQIYACIFAAEAEHMGAFHPAYRIGEVERVLILKLVSRRCGADLETRRTEREFVDGRGGTVCWAVDAEISGCDRWHVNEAVVDMH